MARHAAGFGLQLGRRHPLLKPVFIPLQSKLAPHSNRGAGQTAHLPSSWTEPVKIPHKAGGGASQYRGPTDSQQGQALHPCCCRGASSHAPRQQSQQHQRCLQVQHRAAADFATEGRRCIIFSHRRPCACCDGGIQIACRCGAHEQQRRPKGRPMQRQPCGGSSEGADGAVISSSAAPASGADRSCGRCLSLSS